MPVPPRCTRATTAKMKAQSGKAAPPRAPVPAPVPDSDPVSSTGHEYDHDSDTTLDGNEPARRLQVSDEEDEPNVPVYHPLDLEYPSFWKKLPSIKYALRQSQLYVASGKKRPQFGISLLHMRGVRSVSRVEPEEWRAQCMIVRPTIPMFHRTFAYFVLQFARRLVEIYFERHARGSRDVQTYACAPDEDRKLIFEKVRCCGFLCVRASDCIQRCSVCFLGFPNTKTTGFGEWRLVGWRRRRGRR